MDALTKDRAIRIAIAYAAIAIIVVASLKMIRSPYAKGDFEAFLHAARSIAAGADIYAEPSRPLAEGGVYYLYLPLLAILLLPMAILPVEASILIWTVLNALLVWWIVRTFLSLISFRAPSDLSWTLMLLPVLFTSRYLLHHLYYGQANILVTAMLVLGLKLATRERRLAGGIFVGLAAVIKIVAAPFFVWIGSAMRLREIAGAVLGLVVGAVVVPGLVVGFGENLDYIGQWVGNIALSSDLGTQKVPLGVNVSVQALIHRLFERVPAFSYNGSPVYLTLIELPPIVIAALKRGFELLVLASIVLYRFAFRGRAELIAIWGGVAFTFVALTLFAPTAQKHYFVFLLPAYCYALYLWHAGVGDRGFRSLVVLSFVLGGAKFDGVLGDVVDGLFFALSLSSTGAVLLGAAIFRAAIISKPPAGSQHRGEH